MKTTALVSTLAVLMIGALRADRIPLEATEISRMRAGFGEPKAAKSIDGNPLSLGGRTFTQGVGTHAPSRHTVLCGGKALKFEALVGIDDEVGPDRGSCVFRVLADNRVVAEVAAERGKAQSIVADLAGARKVVLEVTDGGDGNFFDHADWAEAFFTFEDGAKPLPASVLTRQLGILTPPPPKTPRINGATRYGVRPGHPLLYKVAVTGEKPVVITVTGLPEGAVYNPGNRTISGRIAAAGEYPLVVTAENAAGRTERRMTLVVGETLCLTPPMGWNSWNAFAGGVSDEKMRIATDQMVRLGLDEHGYSFVNIDDFWQRNPKNGKDDPTLAGPERHEDGSIWVNARFPDMKGLADYIHAKGLKAGLYSSPGPYTCGGCTGSWLHELQDASTWAEWGFDYVKYDWCSYGQVESGEGHEKFRRPYFLMGRFLRLQPRDIVFSLCQYGWDDVPTWGALAGGQLWRTTGDVFDTWSSIYGAIRAQSANWMYAGPGAWNDADMLVLGKNTWAKGDSRLTPNEQITHMSLWSMLACPLMIGCDLALMDDFTLSLLTNDEVLAIDQDELGAAAALVCEAKDKGYEIWARPLADGSMAFALLNSSDEEQVVEVPLAELGVRGNWQVRDCWRQRDEGVFSTRYAISVPGHATHLIRLSPCGEAGLKRCLKDIRDNAWRLPYDADRRRQRKTSSACPCS